MRARLSKKLFYQRIKSAEKGVSSLSRGAGRAKLVSSIARAELF